MTKKKDVKAEHNKVMIVALSKAVSAVNNISEIEDSPIFKGTVKKTISGFIKWFDRWNKGVYKAYYDTNPKLFESMVSQFDSFDKEVNLGSESVDSLINFYMKMSSIKRDMSMIHFDDDQSSYMYCQICIVKIERMLQTKFWNGYRDRIISSSSTRDKIDAYSSGIYLLN